MRSFKVLIRELRGFLILWLTQSFSALGSAMTNFALIVWSYQAQGSALTTALLSVCSYAPYVVMSIFAGALSDRWNKKAVMLASDSFAALCTVAVLVLLQAGRLEIWHLYCLNALNGLMNTVQQPAADVAISLLTPERHYQKASGLRSLANSLINMLTPMFATALLALAGIHAVILFDLFTFFAAFLSLLFLVKLPAAPSGAARAEERASLCPAGAALLKGTAGHPSPDFVPRRHQFHRVGLQRGIPRHAAFPPRRRRGCSGCRQHRYGSRAAFGQCRRLGAAAAQKPCAGGLQYPAAGHEYGKLFSCLRPQRPRLVSGRGIGLGRHPVDECQPGRADAHPHPHCHAGACVCCAQYAAVLHHSAGVLCRRPAGGQGIRAAHGPPPGRKPAVRFVRCRKGLGRRTSVLPIGTAGCCHLPCVPSGQADLGAGMSGRGARCGPVKRPAALSRTAHCFPCTASIS